jgi:hypothetical protein
MPPRRFYVVAAKEEDEVELFKIEQSPARTVIASSLVASMVGTPSIHITHHEPKDGHPSSAIHISDAHGTRRYEQLGTITTVVHLGTLAVDLFDLAWPPAQPFARTSYEVKHRLDVDEGVFVNAHFYYGQPAAIQSAIDRLLASPTFAFIYPIPDGFATAPGGHPLHYTQLVFDDEADPTVGCLLVACDPPTGARGESGRAAPFDGVSWVAYGAGGVVAEGTIEAEGADDSHGDNG